MKEDYLHHFSLPRLDLLAWVLMTKLAPTYYRKLDLMLNDIGRFRELPTWRKDFKRDWKIAMKTLITMPLNERYRPDVKRFVCTCPHFVVSRFLLCKHLVQRFHPIDPQFFLEVTRNRCSPFWSHPSLKPLATAEDVTKAGALAATQGAGDGDGDGEVDGYKRVNAAIYGFEDLNGEFEDDDDLIDTEGRVGDMDKATFEEKMEDYIRIFRDFCDGLEYQVKFRDTRFLGTLEKDGAGFINFARNCLSRERRYNSSREASPTTWERSTSNAMFYRSRPSRDNGT